MEDPAALPLLVTNFFNFKNLKLMRLCLYSGEPLTRARARAHTHRHIRARAHTHTHVYAHAHARMHARTHAHT